jgi:hypothetical protein
MIKNVFQNFLLLWGKVQWYDRFIQAAYLYIIGQKRFTWGLTKAINTNSEYVIFIAFPQEQWLHERNSVLRYKYIACYLYSYFANVL